MVPFQKLHLEKPFGASSVAMWVKLLLAVPASHVTLLVQQPAASLWIQLLADMSGKAVEDCPSAAIPATHVEGIDGVPALGLAHIWLFIATREMNNLSRWHSSSPVSATLPFR